jgi:hypothetical protein
MLYGSHLAVNAGVMWQPVKAGPLAYVAAWLMSSAAAYGSVSMAGYGVNLCRNGRLAVIAAFCNAGVCLWP